MANEDSKPVAPHSDGNKPSPESPFNSQLAEAVKEIPVVGKIIAYFVKRLGILTTLLILLVVLIFPLTYPLIMTGVLKLMPEPVRRTYAQLVLSAFEEAANDKIDSAIEKLIADNNERLDFVQQFQQNWTSNIYRSPAYAFPLAIGQEFEIGFNPKTIANKPPCKVDQAQLADAAINNDKLFTIRALGAIKYSVDATDAEPRVFGQDFWTGSKDLDAMKANRARTVQVLLNQDIAKEIWPCYSLTSTMEIVVRKTIKTAKTRASPSSAASAP